ncbi:energy transducer TonB family protein [Pelagicoccus albus]|uniref:Energy transducer TonB n=1 Tax=Pelagicoccus albus TaxID=415222 RepID=A0A7X1E782_9BACT|nr:energy transducer TonB [Pelagicoccus albus]MBC2605059.1 energy transducer TonB [Pelagicoccus albus]
MKVSNGGRINWLGLGIALLVLLATRSGAWGQSRLVITANGETHTVVSMDGNVPMIQTSAGPQRVEAGELKFEDAERFTDGALDVLKRDAVLGQDYGSASGLFFFQFRALVQAERDFEDCFIVFVIAPADGDPTYVVHEIRDIDSRGTQQIAMTLPVNPGFGGGTFGYKIFSRGEEVFRREPEDPVMLTEIGQRDAPSSERAESRAAPVERNRGVGEPVEVVDEELLDYPKSLLGTGNGGYATAVFSLDEKGRVFELLDLKVDHPAYAPEVMKSVLGTIYRPGLFRGKPIVATVRRSYFFNEFAPFSEALETIPYPRIEDRDAMVVYAPVPAAVSSKKRKVVLEVRVDELGRVDQVRLAKDDDSPEATVAKEAVTNWQFLPAIVDGYPAVQMLQLPISFEIKE